MKFLENDEKDLVSSFENGEWLPTSDMPKAVKMYSDYAKATLKKDKRINIRISEQDLEELQRKAIHDGLPYQTLISSVLHKYINGSLKEATR